MRRASFLVFCVSSICPLAAACSSGGGGLIALDEQPDAAVAKDAAVADAELRSRIDAQPPPAEAVASVEIVSQIGSGTDVGINDSKACGLPTEEWLQLGERDDLTKDGAVIGNHAVYVRCGIFPSGANNEFDVTLSVTEEGVGAFTLTAQRVGPGATGPVEVAFTRGDTGTFRQTDCSLDFDDPGAGITAGDVVASVTCNRAVFGSSSPRTCTGWAAFHFANCVATY